MPISADYVHKCFYINGFADVYVKISEKLENMNVG